MRSSGTGHPSTPRTDADAEKAEEVQTVAPTSRKITVNLSEEVLNALNELSRRRGLTVTETLRRSISTEKYIQDALDEGAKILIERPNGSIRELVFR
jgi:hypothetical protein